MLDKIFDTVTESTITPGGFAACTFFSLVLGLALAAGYMYKNTYSKSFVVTLALLPAIVQVVMMLVNGNLGTGVAVMGAFSLVRFRSAPGSAKEILSIFMAMAVGLATGVGYLGVAVIFTVIITGMSVLYSVTGFGGGSSRRRQLKVTIPENLDYTSVFDDLLGKYTGSAKLIKVKTTNMGSLFQLTYDIQLKNEKEEKELIDGLRCRNGNLEITSNRCISGGEEL